MLIVFSSQILGKNMKCKCGRMMKHGTKQMRVANNWTRYGMRSVFMCPECANSQLVNYASQLALAEMEVRSGTDRSELCEGQEPIRNSRTSV
jgi:hypothetical protein